MTSPRLESPAYPYRFLDFEEENVLMYLLRKPENEVETKGSDHHYRHFSTQRDTTSPQRSAELAGETLLDTPHLTFSEKERTPIDRKEIC